MSNITGIKIGNSTYNIADSEFREWYDENKNTFIENLNMITAMNQGNENALKLQRYTSINSEENSYNYIIKTPQTDDNNNGFFHLALAITINSIDLLCWNTEMWNYINLLHKTLENDIDSGIKAIEKENNNLILTYPSNLDSGVSVLFVS